ncbi:hypothetical protein N7539_000874 [Penicillium diatomitis]|uniref:Rhodopsin domain-containing protein n=1 Tax=Penicillium diatomitis TaxID=2819901 RepID=A0A9X0C2K8_9EURO|nr:uncharacterized protein N7539_000874 [Penicillium diatomitis]KAJ5495758.1 hypothetical protein N7539_000874 [Penicillium diatomitis]
MGLGFTLPLEGPESRQLCCFRRIHGVFFGDCYSTGICASALGQGFWILFAALNVVVMIGTRKGIGHPSKEFALPNGALDLDAIQEAMFWWWLGQQLYLWASAITKVSIAIALLRLTIKRNHRIFLWFIIVLAMTIMFAFWMILLFDCKPVSYFWTRVHVLSTTGTCTSVEVLLVVAWIYSSCTIICDFSLGFLPIFLVWKLQMNFKTKVAVAGILSLGAVASVAVLVRFPTLPHYRDTDFLSSTISIAIWSIVETGLGITAGSLITLRPLFRWLLGDASVYSQKPSIGGRYPLSSVKSSRAKGSINLQNSNDPSYWRPDLNPDRDGHFVQAVSLQQQGGPHYMNSSQEALYTQPRPDIEGRGVTVQKTFVSTVSPRDHRF